MPSTQSNQTSPSRRDEPNGTTGPRMMTVRAVTQRYGWGRSKTYQLLGEGKLKAVKMGRRLLILVDSCDAVVAALPQATFKPTRSLIRQRLNETHGLDGK
jgi:excisionase family DNA binding protein